MFVPPDLGFGVVGVVRRTLGRDAFALSLLCSIVHDSLWGDQRGWSNDHGCSHPIVICTHTHVPEGDAVC